MATKAKTAAKKPGTAVAVPQMTGIVPGGWRERAAQSIALNQTKVSVLPSASGNFVSFKGGSISLSGRNVGNLLPIVMFDYTYLRQWFSKQYTPDSQASPDCYSLVKDTAPHPKAAVPQSDACLQCRYNEFATSSNGKGKACQEGSRFVFIEASALSSQAAVLAAPIWSARASYLNSKHLSRYVNNPGFNKVPLWGVVTELHCNPDGTSQYALDFVPQQVAIEEDILDAINARMDEAQRLLVAEFPVVTEPERPAARGREQAAPRRRKF